MRPLRPSTLALGLALATAASANDTPQAPPYAQNWSDAGLITANDNWNNVPGIVGYLGDINSASPTGVDPQTLLLDYAAVSAIDVIANQSNPNGLSSGGVAEFDGIADRVVAMQGSGSADAPHLLLFVDMSGRRNLRVRYNVRDIDGSADNAIQQVALHYRIGASGDYSNVPAAYIADATTGPSLATQITPVDVTLPCTVDNAPLVVLRIMTTNAVGNDEWVGIDDIQLTADALGSSPILSIGDVALAEGNVPGNTTTFSFPVTLSSPAPAGGVRFDAASSDGTASAASDYAAIALNDVLIPEGQSGTTVQVEVNHDLEGEYDETFNVALSDIQNAFLCGASATGTILNDDPLEIFQIQGAGNTSPVVDNTVTTIDNVVTALAPNGFFLQTPTARDDGNLATSNGIFVFTGAAPAVAVGDRVNVTGTVQEFFDFTQISGSPVVTPSGTLPLPPPVILDAARPSPLLATPSCYSDANIEFANFECIEGMRVSLADGIVTAPSQRFAVDPIAEAVIQATPARGFREAGIKAPGFAGIAPSIPIWDGNPETFELDPDKLGLPNQALTGGTRFAAEGVIGYDFGDYELWPTQLSITQVVPVPRAVPVASPGELTIGSLNMLRLFDTDQANNINNPAALNCLGNFTCTSLSTCGEVSEEGEFARRMAKLSAYIRQVLRSPDVVAVQEVENLAVLEALAQEIALDDPAVVYTAHLAEGNDVGGIDSGFLVRSGRINAGFTTTQLGKDELFTFDNPDSCLHDRPPYRLDAVFSVGDRPFSVIVNHTRSFIGVGDCRPGQSGERVCLKRLEQAQSIANFVQSFQTANPTVPLVVVGDHNAYEFTDGQVDIMGIIQGRAKLASDPAPDSQLAPATDIVEPNLTSAVEQIAAEERYSYFFDRALQVLDHALLNAPAQAAFAGFGYGRANVDAPLVFQRTENNVLMYGDDIMVNGFDARNERSPVRVSDHDGFVIRLFP